MLNVSNKKRNNGVIVGFTNKKHPLGADLRYKSALRGYCPPECNEGTTVLKVRHYDSYLFQLCFHRNE
jgi:hypothetical protein